MSDAREIDETVTETPEEPVESTDGNVEPEVEIVSFGDDDVPAADGAVSEPEAAELAELRERHLRLRADFENYRKRAERDRTDRVRLGIGEALRELLPVADNLERALSAPGGLDDLRRGVEMIGRQLAELLARQGVVAIESLGRPFDPQLHEAVAREESAEVEAPTVVGELQRGYLHGDRLLRPALVKVAMPAPSSSDEDEP